MLGQSLVESSTQCIACVAVGPRSQCRNCIGEGVAGKRRCCMIMMQVCARWDS